MTFRPITHLPHPLHFNNHYHYATTSTATQNTVPRKKRSPSTSCRPYCLKTTQTLTKNSKLLKHLLKTNIYPSKTTLSTHKSQHTTAFKLTVKGGQLRLQKSKTQTRVTYSDLPSSHPCNPRHGRLHALPRTTLSTLASDTLADTQPDHAASNKSYL